MSKTWKSTPIPNLIMDALIRKSALTDSELLDILRSRYNYISHSELKKVLMKMEIEGLIILTPLTKDKKRVELIKKDL